MTGTRALLVRGGLIFLTVVSAVLGGYILLFPESFFSWSWVNMGMAYNPHLLLDYGAMNLAVAIPLGGAAITMTPASVRAALGSYAVWGIAHFLIHVRYWHHIVAETSTEGAGLLLSALAIGGLLPIVLLALTFRTPAPDRRPADQPQQGLA
ncbi:hypothetical protein [Streptomyces profundus]|uniref:hypothetical protein n=1 Tax=Streptomyces profundus TaxID=2867410 RepID=UPI001D1611E4|nr:hypothetical protein [Streptomyces sp. MA3_2.13]UED83290.1 hypothetical protein K4G22_02975 [Streptomyces sp. MA3_2.13]